MYLCLHCLYHSLKVFFEEKQYFFADLPPNSAFPNLTFDARSSVIYNLYGENGVKMAWHIHTLAQHVNFKSPLAFMS